MTTKRGDELGEKMVRWLSPRGLFVTGVDVVLSGIFGRYSDKREIQAAIEMPTPPRAEGETVWIDYVADVADGWNSTYGIAWLLARPHLIFDHDETTRGQFLVMGGDQVYPRAKWSEYRARLVAPYRAASHHIAGPTLPRLFAIPGNHDWYDGLTSFMRLFRRDEMHLGWRTPQRRSYFALQLAERWWLLGIDLAFDAYIDDAQLTYFRELTEAEGGSQSRVRELMGGDRGPRIKRGDHIILCTAKPSWAIEGQEGGKRTNRATLGADALQAFERTIVETWGCHLPLVLSGDLHHYSRYRSNDTGQHRITCGGGGAYLYPTHHLRSPIIWGTGDASDQYELEQAYPDQPTSKGLRKRVLVAGFANPSFGLLAGLVYLLLISQMRVGIQVRGSSVADSFAAVGWRQIVSAPFVSPIGGLLWLLILVGLYAFADAKHWWGRTLMAAGHGIAYMATLAVSVLGIALVLDGWLDVSSSEGRGWWALGIGAAALVGAGYLCGSCVMGVYLWFAQLIWRHPNEAFAPLHLGRSKGFLRMKLDVRANTLSIFPIAVDRACKLWEVDDDVIEPAQPLSPRLIEGPIVIEGSA